MAVGFTDFDTYILLYSFIGRNSIILASLAWMFFLTMSGSWEIENSLLSNFKKLTKIELSPVRHHLSKGMCGWVAFTPKSHGTLKFQGGKTLWRQSCQSLNRGEVASGPTGRCYLGSARTFLGPVVFFGSSIFHFGSAVIIRVLFITSFYIVPENLAFI